MKFVRWFLGRLILALDFLTSPRPLKRNEEDQAVVDAKTATMSLYQFHACPFCVKVRRQIRKGALNIELKDAKNDMVNKEKLTKEGGKHKVPCLRIEQDGNNIIWLYNSKDINSYLQEEFKLSS